VKIRSPATLPTSVIAAAPPAQASEIEFARARTGGAHPVSAETNESVVSCCGAGFPASHNFPTFTT
jgi:hypothetical protein